MNNPLPFPPSVKCLYTIKILDLLTNQISCMPCYINIHVNSNVNSSFNIVLSHYLVTEHYGNDMQHCNYCNGNLTINIPATNCMTCANKYPKLLAAMHTRLNATHPEINVQQIEFKYDTLSNRILETHYHSASSNVSPVSLAEPI